VRYPHQFYIVHHDRDVHRFVSGFPYACSITILREFGKNTKRKSQGNTPYDGFINIAGWDHNTARGESVSIEFDIDFHDGLCLLLFDGKPWMWCRSDSSSGHSFLRGTN